MFEKACFVLLTNQCNLKCPHCYNELDTIKSSIIEDQTNLSLPKLSVLFSKLVENGFTKVLFSGGEALLRADIFEIIKEAKSKGLNTALFTNGHTLSENVAIRLGNAGLKEIRISFNEMVWIKNGEQYERIFAKQTKYLSKLQEMGISVGYVYIVSGYNINYTYKTFLQLQELGASMKIQPLYLPKNFKNFNEASASTIPIKKWNELKKLFSNNDLKRNDIGEKTSSVYGDNEEICNYIDFLIHIYSSGKTPDFCPTGPILVIDSRGIFHPCLFRADIECGNISNENDVCNINTLLNKFNNLSEAQCYSEECLSAFR